MRVFSRQLFENILAGKKKKKKKKKKKRCIYIYMYALSGIYTAIRRMKREKKNKRHVTLEASNSLML